MLIIDRTAKCQKVFIDFFLHQSIFIGIKKFIFNAFDYDEFYDLEKDPHELHNAINDPLYREDVMALCSEMQRIVAETGDTTLGDATYYMHRFLPIGPQKGAGTAEFKIYNKEF